MKHKLRYLFWEWLKLSYQDLNHWGNPCSGLLEQMMLYQDKFLDRIVGDRTKDTHEYRLNEAGLKMLWLNYNGKIFITICGDQKDLYPEFVEKAMAAARRYQFFPLNEQE